MKLGNNFTRVGTRVKLFPNFTRHHLITHTKARQPPRQPSSTRPLSKNFFFSSLQRYKVKVSYYRRYNGFKNVFGFYFHSFTVTFERNSVCYIRFSFRYSVFYFALPSLYPCLLILFQFALRPFTKNAKRR